MTNQQHKDIWILAEQWEGEIQEISYETADSRFGLTKAT